MRNNTPHVVAISGSVRTGSYTLSALERVLAAAERAGATTDLIDLGELDLPLLDPENGDAGDAQLLRERVGAADTLVLGTPMYHGSYSSVLKTALDYLSAEEIGEKTVGLLAVAGGAFPLVALEHLRSVCRSLGAWVLPHQVAIPNVDDAFEGTALVEETTAERVERLGRHVVGYATIEQSAVEIECQDPLVASN